MHSGEVCSFYQLFHEGKAPVSFPGQCEKWTYPKSSHCCPLRLPRPIGLAHAIISSAGVEMQDGARGISESGASYFPKGWIFAFPQDVATVGGRGGRDGGGELGEEGSAPLKKHGCCSMGRDGA